MVTYPESHLTFQISIPGQIRPAKPSSHRTTPLLRRSSVDVSSGSNASLEPKVVRLARVHRPVDWCGAPSARSGWVARPEEPTVILLDIGQFLYTVGSSSRTPLDGRHKTEDSSSHIARSIHMAPEGRRRRSDILRSPIVED